MAHSSDKNTAPSSPLIQQLLEAFDALAGGVHPGFRPAHAKGAMCSGTFAPLPEAAKLTRAPHAVRPSTRVIVRYSDATGVPTIPDTDPHAGPRGFAVRFYLGEHEHTDIVSHSHNGFPTRTGEEFLEFARAAAASGPDAAHPTPIEAFLMKHPKALHFVEAPKPVPASFANESFFAVTAFRFTNQEGASRFGRFRIRPEAGNAYLTAEEVAKKPANFLFDELSQRLAKGPIKLGVFVQLAAEGDEAADSTAIWPETRPETRFGTITLTSRANDADPELRKIIFDPIPRVDGIDPSADPLIDVRSALYLLSGRRRRAASA
jgi:catalase